MYLLDTNVISELRKFETGRADRRVERWSIGKSKTEFYLSSVTILELQMGVLQIMRKDHAQSQVLHAWLHHQVLLNFAGRILPVDADVALECASLHTVKSRSYKDSLIAATALVHGLTVVTRNVKDFEPMGCKVLNPWAHQ